MAAEIDRMGLRERKKQRTRDALSLATIRLIAERGWQNVRIEDIAAAADVSVRTFRNYFSGKAEAIAARHLDRMRRIARELALRPAGEPLWEAVSASVLSQFAPEHDIDGETFRGRGHADGIRLMLSEPVLHGEIIKATARAQDELAEVIAQRTGTDATREVFPKLMAAAIVAAISVAIEHAVRADPPLPLGRVLRDVLHQLTAGLPVP